MTTTLITGANRGLGAAAARADSGPVVRLFPTTVLEDIRETPPRIELEDGEQLTVRAGSRVRVRDWSLPDDAANTVAGLVIHEAQMIPTVGQVFSFHGFRFEVTSRDGNRITGLKIRPL